ncbi:MAG: hypothetical protein FWE45_00905 [Firmicutes bacterium]|nr:hypothetical protein [Bacillota bacterium]
MKRIILPMMTVLLLVVTSVALAGCVDFFRPAPTETHSGPRLNALTFQKIELAADSFGYDFDRFENIAIVTLDGHNSVSFARYNNVTTARHVFNEYFFELRYYFSPYSQIFDGANFQSYRTILFDTVFILYRVNEWVLVATGPQEDIHMLEDFLNTVLIPVVQSPA